MAHGNLVQYHQNVLFKFILLIFQVTDVNKINYPLINPQNLINNNNNLNKNTQLMENRIKINKYLIYVSIMFSFFYHKNRV